MRYDAADEIADDDNDDDDLNEQYGSSPWLYICSKRSASLKCLGWSLGEYSTHQPAPHARGSQIGIAIQ